MAGPAISASTCRLLSALGALSVHGCHVSRSRMHQGPLPHTRTSHCRGKQLTPTGYGLRPILPSLTAGSLPLTAAAG